MSDAPLVPRTVEQLKRYELELTKKQEAIIQAIIKSIEDRHPRWTGAYGNLEIPPPLPPEFVKAVSDLNFMEAFLEAQNPNKKTLARTMIKKVRDIIYDMVDLYFGYPQIRHIMIRERGDVVDFERRTKHETSEESEDSEED